MDIENRNKSETCEGKKKSSGALVGFGHDFTNNCQNHKHSEHTKNAETHALVDNGLSGVKPGGGALGCLECEHVKHEEDKA